MLTARLYWIAFFFFLPCTPICSSGSSTNPVRLVLFQELMQFALYGYGCRAIFNQIIELNSYNHKHGYIEFLLSFTTFRFRKNDFYLVYGRRRISTRAYVYSIFINQRPLLRMVNNNSSSYLYVKYPSILFIIFLRY